MKAWLRKYFSSSSRYSSLLYDATLFWLIIGLLAIGLVMVTSASIAVGQRLYDDPFFFAKRDVFYLLLSFVFSLFVLRIPIRIWQGISVPFLLVTLFLLLVVLFVGGTVNGASRWIAFGPLRIQPAEISKLALCCYISSYLVRKVDEVRSNFWGFCKPMAVMVLLALLLLAQPDLGTVVVLFVTTLSMLFLAGAKLWQFLAIIGCGLFAVASLILTQAYRLKRVVSFLDPWKDPFGAGYQLIQSLMAFGRGGFWGQGLGNSIQKLAYLPEPHTDFISAILAEELGYVGMAAVLIMLFILVLRAMKIGRTALQADQRFAGFLACSIGIWIAFQTLINVGAASGMLPTKGLTLPLISYGGSSLLVMVIAVMLLLRIDYENRCLLAQAFVRGKS